MSQQRRERRPREVEDQAPPKDTGFRKKLIIGIVVAMVVVGIYYYFYHREAHKYDVFARCLTEKGVKMYGAYWCPHCAEQKQLFDASFEYAPYIECGVQGNTAKLQQVCIDAGIKHFPTWQFPPVGERVEGTMPLADLSFRTGCPLQ